MSNEKISLPAKDGAKNVLPERVPVAQRNILTYAGARPDRYYRWVLQSNLDIYLQASYQFEHNGTAGDPRVADGSNLDTRISKADRGGERLYLMWLPIELRKADLAAKELRNKQTTESIYRADAKQGGYGATFKQNLE